MWQTDGFAASQQGQSARAVECWGHSNSGFRSLKRHSLPERKGVAPAASSSGEMKTPYRETLMKHGTIWSPGFLNKGL